MQRYWFTRQHWQDVKSDTPGIVGVAVAVLLTALGWYFI